MKSSRSIALGLALLLTALALAAQAGPRRLHPAYELMLKAAQKTLKAHEALYQRKRDLQIYDATLDPNRTGLVGVEYSRITTTIGSLKAKRTGTNPDFAAYIVRELVDHGVGVGDSVLVTMTGSFPGLNVAVIMALETLDVSSLRICSLGSSSYGANQEDYTWLDMENTLYVRDVMQRRSNFVTLGGTGDVGGGLAADIKWSLRHKAERLGYPILKSRSFKKQSALRREQLGDPSHYVLLINIGGNQAMLGSGKQGRELPGGWINPSVDSLETGDADEAEGIIFDFLEAGIPVLNLLHIEDIATGTGILVDPQPMPKPGESAVYFQGPLDTLSR
jgi:poly-gamma-glutamate system protein